MDHPVDQRRRQTAPNVTSADRHVERAKVAVKVRDRAKFLVVLILVVPSLKFVECNFYKYR